MNFINIYLFDENTGVYTDLNMAQESPEQPGEYIMPLCSCTDAPPEYSTNQIPQRIGGAEGSWSLISDYRGQTIYNQTTGATEEVAEVGDIPAGYALTQPFFQLQAKALSDLASQFGTKSTVDVADSNSVLWSGGLQSALSIDGAARLAAAAGEANIDIYDAANTVHTLTIAEANAVASIVGAAYQAIFKKYQSYKVSIVDAMDSPSLATAVEAVTWA